MCNIVVFIMLLSYVYEDSDSLIVYDDSLIIAGVHIYNNKIHLKNAHITIMEWSGMADSSGWLTLQAPLVICESLTGLQGSGKGCWGGNAGHGDGYGPGAGGVGGISGGGGGGAGYGGAGGNGGDYYPGSGGTTYGNTADTLINMGSGGGAGQYLSTIDGFGGNGGAFIRIQGYNIIIDSANFTLDGHPGQVGGIGLEGGGGGSGGGILIRADSVTLHHTQLSVSGNDGAGSEFGGGGGGGGGRIKIFYSEHLDTLNCLCSAAGGAGGQGYQGSNGDPGHDGTIHIEQLMGIRIYKTKKPAVTVLEGTIVHQSFTVLCVDSPAILSLYDISGNRIHTYVLTQPKSCIPIQDLPAGVYFLTTDLQSDYYLKIIVVK